MGFCYSKRRKIDCTTIEEFKTVLKNEKEDVHLKLEKFKNHKFEYSDELKNMFNLTFSLTFIKQFMDLLEDEKNKTILKNESIKNEIKMIIENFVNFKENDFIPEETIYDLKSHLIEFEKQLKKTT